MTAYQTSTATVAPQPTHQAYSDIFTPPDRQSQPPRPNPPPPGATRPQPMRDRPRPAQPGSAQPCRDRAVSLMRDLKPPSLLASWPPGLSGRDRPPSLPGSAQRVPSPQGPATRAQPRAQPRKPAQEPRHSPVLTRAGQEGGSRPYPGSKSPPEPETTAAENTQNWPVGELSSRVRTQRPLSNKQHCMITKS